jgi:hypothetical protein
MQPFRERMASGAPETLRIRIYPGEEGATKKFTLYEDDGISTGYERGASARTELAFTLNGHEGVLEVAPGGGSYDGKPQSRTYVIELAEFPRPLAVRAFSDGVPLAASAVTVGLRSVTIPSMPADSKITLRMEF